MLKFSFETRLNFALIYTQSLANLCYLCIAYHIFDRILGYKKLLQFK